MSNINLKYRDIMPSDMSLIYEWNNEAQTRLNSFNSTDISMETHEDWFKKKLNDSNAYYLIVLNEETPVALVRYDVSKDFTTVGINLSKLYRGKGLSSRILKETSAMYFSKHQQPVLAWIKPINIASIKAFESAGFVFEKEESVMNHKAIVYKLEYNLPQT